MTVVVAITLAFWCSLCRQAFADRPLLPTTPRGSDTPLQIDAPIPSLGLASPLPLPLVSRSVPPLPDPTHILKPIVQNPSDLSLLPLPLPVVLDGPAILILPYDDTPSSVSQASGSDQKPQSPLLMAYYPDWVGEDFPPEQIDFSRYDWLDFAFAVPNSRFELVWDDDEAPSLLSRLVAAAHATTTKVKLSIGGWTGSKYFSPAVATDESRRIFSNNILATYNAYNLDGIDLDWEYPGHEGEDGNLYDPADTSNFLAFLKVLRATLPPSAKISAAVQTLPFLGANGDPISDASGFGEVFDWILLMNYDTWESTSPPGPNAPLYDACNNSTQPASSASAGVVAWAKSGFPVSKLVLGLPSYGYVQKTSSERLRTRSPWDHSRSHHWWHEHEDDEKHHVHEDDEDERPADGHRWDTHGGWGGGSDDSEDDDDRDDGHGGGGGHNSYNPPPASPDSPRPLTLVDSDGQIQFRDLVGQGVLIPSIGPEGAIQYIPGGGFERRWDACSQTPFLRSTASGQVVTYDDTESLALKARFAKDVGMMGVNIFDVHGDTEEYHLIDSIRKAMGL